MYSRRFCSHLAYIARFATLFFFIQLLLLSAIPATTPHLFAQGEIIYVNDDAGGLNNGSRWEDAFTKLQNALTVAVDGDQIWVAAGIYFPDETGVADNNLASSTFHLKSGVAIYGGFAGTETELSQRDVDANLTLLSGDLRQDDIRDDNHIMLLDGNNGTNATHVVSALDLPTSARLDGFTITGGTALGVGSNCPGSCGGGFYSSASSATLANITFNGNVAYYGGGAHLIDPSSSTWEHVSFLNNEGASNGGGLLAQSGANLTLTQGEFTANETQGYGAGAFFDGITANLEDATFTLNKAISLNGRGGGLAIFPGTTVTLTTVIFNGNEAHNSGGAIFVNEGSMRFANGVLAGNRAQRAGAILNAGDMHLFNVTITGNQTADQDLGAFHSDEFARGSLSNSIIWGNRTNGGAAANFTVITPEYVGVQNSLLEGDIPPNAVNVGGNLSEDPLFLREVNCGNDSLCADLSPDDDGEDYGDLRLRAASPAIDAGDNKFADDFDTDILGNPRIVAIRALPATVDMGAYERLNAAPVANAGGPYTVDEGTPLDLVGSGSTDEESPIASYAWDCTNDGSNEVTSSSAIGSTCIYPDDGPATLKLTVTDQWGVTHTATAEVTVLNVNPTFTATFDQSTFVASAKTFNLGNFTDPGADAPWQVTVEWGDGTPSSEFTAATPGTLTALHTYASEGFFNVNVTVSDNTGSSSDSFVARVNPATVGIVVGKIVAGDEGVGGVEVKLTDDLVAAGVELERTTLTDTDGSYSFDYVAPGDYRLGFTMPNGYALVGPSQHSINVSAGKTATAPNFTLRPVPDGEDGQIFIPAIQKR